MPHHPVRMTRTGRRSLTVESRVGGTRVLLLLTNQVRHQPPDTVPTLGTLRIRVLRTYAAGSSAQ
jgi:hypothetical protein